MQTSKPLKFFFKASEKSMRDRRTRDKITPTKLIERINQKKFSDLEKNQIKKWGLETPNIDTRDLEDDPNRRKKLRIFLDRMKDIHKEKSALELQVSNIYKQISTHYKELSKLIFSLADVVNGLASVSEKTEKLCSKNFKGVSPQSTVFKSFKVALYSWSAEMTQAQNNIVKEFWPVVKTMKADSLRQKGMFNLSGKLVDVSRIVTKKIVESGSEEGGEFQGELKRLTTIKHNLGMKIFQDLISMYREGSQRLVKGLERFCVKQNQLDSSVSSFFRF